MQIESSLTVDDDEKYFQSKLTMSAGKPGTAEIAMATSAVWDEAMRDGENSMIANVTISIIVTRNIVVATLTGWNNNG
jgi:hypothetical protein